MARRTYSLDDQLAFAALSGDWNPLHVDPVAARRTLFGQQLVHGIHLLLCALDDWLAGGTGGVRITDLKVVFRKPANLRTPIDFEVSGTDEVKLVARAGEIRVMEATVRWRSETAPPGLSRISRAAPPTQPPGVPVERSPSAWRPLESASSPWPFEPIDVPVAALSEQRGAIEIAIDGAPVAERFPHALARLGNLAIAELLATTRLVGMVCPGLHSVYGGLTLRARDGDTAVLAYEVTRTVPKVSLVDIAVHGPLFEGTLETFARPRPRTGPSRDELTRAIEPGEFAGQTALVVGGSRGIGEAIARSLAAGGAHVCATYFLGIAEAEQLERELEGATGKLAIAPLDVTQPIDLTVWPFERPPTHLYYTATSRIPSGKFSAPDLHDLLWYDVDGLHAVVTAAVARWGGSLVVWVPSTALLDTGSGNTAFALSKAALEELCRRLPGLPRANVHVPRLPRVATDQNAALVELPAKPALEVVLPELRRIGAPRAEPAPARPRSQPDDPRGRSEPEPAPDPIEPRPEPARGRPDTEADAVPGRPDTESEFGSGGADPETEIESVEPTESGGDPEAKIESDGTDFEIEVESGTADSETAVESGSDANASPRGESRG